MYIRVDARALRTAVSRVLAAVKFTGSDIARASIEPTVWLLSENGLLQVWAIVNRDYAAMVSVPVESAPPFDGVHVVGKELLARLKGSKGTIAVHGTTIEPCKLNIGDKNSIPLLPWDELANVPMGAIATTRKTQRPVAEADGILLTHVLETAVNHFTGSTGLPHLDSVHIGLRKPGLVIVEATDGRMMIRVSVPSRLKVKKNRDLLLSSAKSKALARALSEHPVAIYADGVVAQDDFVAIIPLLGNKYPNTDSVIPSDKTVKGSAVFMIDDAEASVHTLKKFSKKLGGDYRVIGPPGRVLHAVWAGDTLTVEYTGYGIERKPEEHVTLSGWHPTPQWPTLGIDVDALVDFLSADETSFFRACIEAQSIWVVR